ncbi:MAG: YraN family protein [Clostridia bacterium]|nr:YraN family protein [Clostridia bacterium]
MVLFGKIFKLNNRQKGAYGEKLALKYLKKKKYKLIEKNYKALKCEIDIIMQKGDTLVFVEVKSRMPDSKYGTGAEAVDYRKQCHIIKTAQCFIKANQLYDMNVSFDVVEVDLKSKKVNHIPNAFFMS